MTDIRTEVLRRPEIAALRAAVHAANEAAGNAENIRYNSSNRFDMDNSYRLRAEHEALRRFYEATVARAISGYHDPDSGMPHA